MNRDFLLGTKTAKSLYHDCAEALPVIDFHNHLQVDRLAENRAFENLTELWVAGDPYKHRVMRICGIEEERITGSAEPFEKFEAWCQVYPQLAGHPLYDWSRLEMQAILGIDLSLNPSNAKAIWREANDRLREEAFRPRALLKRFNVVYAAPCTNFTDDLAAFAACGEPIAPSLRGDDILSCRPDWLRKLGEMTGIAAETLAGLEAALNSRMAEFHQAGCRFADLALDNGFAYQRGKDGGEACFQKAAVGIQMTKAESICLRSALLRLFGGLCAKWGWTLQLHIGAQRFTSTRLRRVAGPAGGFATIGSTVDVEALASLLDDLEQNAVGLPRMILYTLNPSDNAVFSCFAGAFAGDGIRGKVQQGAAWWWCDHLAGMRDVFESLAAYGVLSVSIGMTTDSRSLLSFVRHEYYRRALCGWLGAKAEAGEFPGDRAILEALVYNLSFGNAATVLKEGNIHAV